MAVYKKDLVSVCIASYNHARYLPQTIDSILAQTWQNFELIIVDDGSTDNSHEILTDYQRRYPDKIRYFWHDDHANRGISASCNLALEKAQGEYFAWLGSDDYWLPDKLAKQVKYLVEHPEVGMVHSAAMTLDAAGNLCPVLTKSETYITHDAWRQLIIANNICASTVLIVRDCFDKVGAYFDEKLVFSDWELWIRLAARHPIGFISEPLAVYRVHSQNVSISPQKAATILEHNLAVIETAAEQFPQMDQALKQKALARAHVRAGLDFFADGESSEGRQHLLKAAELLSSSWPCESEDEFVETVVAYAIHMLQAGGSDNQQGVHFLQRVFSSIAPNSQRKATARFYVTKAFISHNQGHFPEVRRCVRRAIILNPNWLRNGGVLSILADAFLGWRIAGGLRHLARMFVSHKPRWLAPLQRGL